MKWKQTIINPMFKTVIFVALLFSMIHCAKLELKTISMPADFMPNLFYSKTLVILPAVNGYFNREFAELVDLEVNAIAKKNKSILKTPESLKQTYNTNQNLRKAVSTIAYKIHEQDNSDKDSEEFGGGISASVVSAKEFDARVEKNVSLENIKAQLLANSDNPELVALGSDYVILPYISMYSPLHERAQYWFIAFPIWMSKTSYENIFINFYIFDGKTGQNVSGSNRNKVIRETLKQILNLWEEQ